MPTEPLPKRVVLLRPIGGMVLSDPPEVLQPEMSPDIQNFHVYQGVLVKRPGYALFPGGMAALGTRINGIYSTHDDSDNTRLYCNTKTGLYRFNNATQAWDAMTGAALTGGDGQMFSYETSQNSLVFCQGVDNIQLMALSATAYASISANAFPTKYLSRFADRLYCAGLTEGGVAKPYRTRWPVASDHTDWIGTGSGFRDNTEQPYFIRNMLKLQAELAVYTERSILLARRTGASLGPAQYDIVAANVGLYADYTLAGRNEIHMFLGNDDFYVFNGGAPISFGLSVRDQVFQTIAPLHLTKNFAVILSDLQEYLCFVTTGINTTPDTVWAYNYVRQIWHRWAVSGPTCGTLHRLDSGSTIDQLIGTMDQQNWVFDAAQLQQAYPTLLTGSSDGKVYKWSSQYPADNGSAIDAYWTSKDWTARDVSDGYSRHMIKLKSVGVAYIDPGTVFNLSMYWSIDGGSTWLGPEIITTTTSLLGRQGDVTWFHEITAKRIRVKVRNNSATEIPQISQFHFDLEIDAQKF